MDKITFKPDTFIVMTEDPNKMAVLSRFYDEAQRNGTDIVLLDVQLDTAGDFVRSMKFGVGADVSMENIITDTVFPNFFSPKRLYRFLIVSNDSENACQLSGGITPGGTELFSNWTIPARVSSTIPGSVAIPLNRSIDVSTPFFFWKATGDFWGGARLSVKTDSRSL